MYLFIKGAQIDRINCRGKFYTVQVDQTYVRYHLASSAHVVCTVQYRPAVRFEKAVFSQFLRALYID